MPSSIKSLFLLLMLVTPGLLTAETASVPGTSVYLISPSHGEIVTSPVTVRFGLAGMGVAPAGVERDNTGHHHLLIDLENLPASNKPIPADDQHRHFGGGQTEAVIELSPGEHTLQLLLADHNHVPHKPVIASKKITITVK